jgi:hypothetical protein
MHNASEEMRYLVKRVTILMISWCSDSTISNLSMVFTLGLVYRTCIHVWRTCTEVMTG